MFEGMVQKQEWILLLSKEPDTSLAVYPQQLPVNKTHFLELEGNWVKPITSSANICPSSGKLQWHSLWILIPKTLA